MKWKVKQGNQNGGFDMQKYKRSDNGQMNNTVFVK